MNNKIITLIIGILGVILLTFGIYIISTKPNNESTNNSQSNINESGIVNNNDNTTSNKKIAVIYFSATGTTKSVAETISNITKGDLIEIVPKEKYTDKDLNWNDKKSRTSIECNDSKSRPEISNTINVDNYDTIFLGYPIWWGDVPHIILTFMDTYKLDGKTIIPFCTSGGTSISGSMNTLKNYNKNVNWIDGTRLRTSSSEINNWVNNLNY